VADENSLMMIVYQGNNYQIRVGDLLSVAGVPTTTQVIAGTGMTGGGQLTGNVTLSVAPKGVNGTLLSDTGVTSGVYGNATNIPVFTVDSTGRVTAATTVPATGGSGSYVPTTTEVIAGNGLTGGGALSGNVTLTANFSSALPQAGFQTGSAGVANTLSRGDHKHPAVDLSADDQVDNILGLNNGGTARSLVMQPGAVIWSGADGLYVGPAGVAGQVLLSGGTSQYTWSNQSGLNVGQATNINGGAANQVLYQTGAGTTGFVPAPTSANTILYWNGTNLVWGSVPGTGTVTSVGLALPATDFAVSGSPVTGSGTLTGAWLAQPANRVLSGPTSGADATPAFRALTNQDIPSSLSGKTIVTSTIDSTAIGATTASSGAFTTLTSSSTTTLNGTSIPASKTLVDTDSAQTLTNKTISGASNTLSNIGNASLTNSAITINGSSVSLGGSTSITPSSIGAISAVSGTANEVTATTVGTAVTVSLPSALTFTGKTITGGTYASPAITGTVKLTGAGASAYTPFVQTFNSAVSNFNGYQLSYIQNTNNGSDASVDYVAYNDSSDVNSYFIDVGISSSNYTNATYTIFPANGAYVYTGGGSSGQASALLLGTSNTASDITFFTGGTLLANTRATIKGTGNFLINTTTDTGYKLNVNGTTYFSGASTFGSTVLLNADPTIALQAATKQYVDNQVTAGLHIHDPVRVETTGNLTATYAQGGTTFNITDITSTTTVTTSVSHGLSVNDQIWLTASAGNGLSINVAYFVFSIPAVNQLTLSLTFNGAQITGLTNASGLTYATRANSGVGATLTNSGAQAALTLDGVALSVADRVMVRLQTNGAENGVYTVTTVGSGATNWVLTRATDSNQVNPADPNGVGTGDYYFTQEGTLNAGDSHVLTTEPNTMIIGYTTLTYTQFSGSVDYTGGTNITVTGQTINVSGTIAATLGGTGTSTVTTGDLLYGSATNTWSKLPLGVAYKSLIVNAAGTQLEWNATPLNQPTAVSGELGVANGGTGVNTLTGLAYGNGTSAFTAATGAQVVAVIGSTAVTNATTATNLAGGAASQIPYQSGSGATSFISNGTAGQVLRSAGASAPTWGNLDGGTF
jgi:hypothetical protein